MSSRVLASLALAATLATGTAAAADDWPARPLRIVAPFPAGGATDAVARLVATRLGEALGQPVTVENKPGAGGNIGADLVARAAPDGYTLLLGGGNLAINPALPRNAALDPTKAFVPVTRLVTQPVVITAHPSFAAGDVRELVALAKRTSPPIAYATAGIGTTPHVAALLLMASAQIELLHIPHSASTAPQQSIVAGEVPVGFSLLPAVQAFVASGQMKPIGVTSAKRIAPWPDVPTVAESGFPGFEVVSWYGILAPAGTPAPVVERLNAELLKILREREVIDKLASLGMDTVADPSPRFASILAAEVARWADLARRPGVRLD